MIYGTRAAAMMDTRKVGVGGDKDKDRSEGRQTIPATCACGALDRMNNFNRIMLRFRPIAPKLTFGGPSYGGLVFDEERVIMVSEDGRNRKYVRVGSGSRTTYWWSNEGGERTSGGSVNIRNIWGVTPQPLNQLNGGFWHCECNEKVREKEKQDHEEYENPMIRLKLRRDAFGTRRLIARNGKAGRVKGVEAVATVGYVRTCMNDRDELGSTNWQRIKNLENDTCPAFVSDFLNSVQWMNGAFRRMVNGVEWKEDKQQGQGRDQKVEVQLRMEENVPYKSFTCQMKVQYRLGKEIKVPEIVPCDAWEMKGGGYAWRLDVKAALRLGL